MGAYRYIRESFQKAYAERSPELRARLAAWRKQDVVVRAENPTNPISARRVGYKARQDYIIVRVRGKRGNRARRRPAAGRKPGKSRKFVEPGQGWERVAQEKARRKFINFDVVGSYVVGEDGTARYYEVVMHNPNWPSQPSLRKPELTNVPTQPAAGKR